jgi:hypothetical protein
MTSSEQANIVRGTRARRAHARPLAVLAASALAAVTALVAVPSAPAQSSADQPSSLHPRVDQQGVGSGRAVIRLDAPTATVVKTGKNSYRMVLPEGTTGQWMGERSTPDGSAVLVRDITAKKLSSRWSNFKYGKSGVYASLVWNSSAYRPSWAGILLSEPMRTDEGVRFDFTSRSAVPRSLTDVTLNIAQAAGKARGTTYSATVAGAMKVSVEVIDALTIHARLYDSAGTCWEKTISGRNSASVGSGTCDGTTTYTNYITGSYPYGVQLSPPEPKASSAGALVRLIVTPVGQAPFNPYSHNFYWTA